MQSHQSGRSKVRNDRTYTLESECWLQWKRKLHTQTLHIGQHWSQPNNIQPIFAKFIGWLCELTSCLRCSYREPRWSSPILCSLYWRPWCPDCARENVMWLEASPLIISLNVREILPKSRHVGTDYDDIRAFHFRDQRRSNKRQTAGT